ncbi:DUF4416 family protein, partial [Candidatus Peregrinibacteria bacterium]|nr:DUF4416 family protein [Candidatus Peregrinibacteria bacterium]
GYLTLSGLVLASMKDFAHRIYIAKNVYAEVTLTWRHDKGFEPMAWTYPDYKSEGYLAFFIKVRDIYYKQIRRI